MKAPIPRLSSGQIFGAAIGAFTHHSAPAAGSTCCGLIPASAAHPRSFAPRAGSKIIFFKFKDSLKPSPGIHNCRLALVPASASHPRSFAPPSRIQINIPQIELFFQAFGSSSLRACSSITFRRRRDNSCTISAATAVQTHEPVYSKRRGGKGEMLCTCRDRTGVERVRHNWRYTLTGNSLLFVPCYRGLRPYSLRESGIAEFQSYQDAKS